MDTDRPGDEAYEPVEVEAGIVESDFAMDPEPAPKSRLLLGALAGLGVTLVGVVAWSLLFVALENDYVGIAVVFALIIGYVVREVSRRSDLLPRVVSAVLAAVLCYLGTITASAAYTSKDTDLPFWDTFEALMKHPNVVFENRQTLTWVIYAAAVAVAFMSAGPAKTKPAKTSSAPAAAPAEPVGDDPEQA